MCEYPILGEYSWSVVIASLVLAVCVALVLIGGVKRIASVSQVIVPFMAVLYVLFVGVLVITNITKVPTAFKIIVEAAFFTKSYNRWCCRKHACSYAEGCCKRYLF